MRACVVLCCLIGLSLAIAAGASGSPPASASGTTEPVDLSVIPAGVDGLNELYHIVSTSTFIGTFSGTLNTELDEVLHPTGNSTLTGTDTCVCTVDGRSGTIVFRTEAKIVGDPFFYEDTKTVISATGGLAGLHATLRVQWDGGIATYTGSYHFDP